MKLLIQYLYDSIEETDDNTILVCCNKNGSQRLIVFLVSILTTHLVCDIVTFTWMHDSGDTALQLNLSGKYPLKAKSSLALVNHDTT